MMKLDTLNDVLLYIYEHERHFGVPPASLGLTEKQQDAILEEIDILSQKNNKMHTTLVGIPVITIDEE